MSDRPPEKTLAELAPASYECPSCGYIYNPAKGESKNNTPAGTTFEELPLIWNCPVCGVDKGAFRSIGAADAPSGFEENLQYGFGVNNMTPNQKNLLIFGALGLGFLFFLSLYGLG
jgi:rubredoxin